MAFEVEVEQPAAGGFCEGTGCLLSWRDLISVETGYRLLVVPVTGTARKLGPRLGRLGVSAGACPPYSCLLCFCRPALSKPQRSMSRSAAAQFRALGF